MYFIAVQEGAYEKAEAAGDIFAWFPKLDIGEFTWQVVLDKFTRGVLWATVPKMMEDLYNIEATHKHARERVINASRRAQLLAEAPWARLVQAATQQDDGGWHAWSRLSALLIKNFYYDEDTPDRICFKLREDCELTDLIVYCSDCLYNIWRHKCDAW